MSRTNGRCLTCNQIVDVRAGYHDCPSLTDRIAQLEAELAEARKEACRKDALLAVSQKDLRDERAAHACTQAEAAAVKHDRDVLLKAREQYLAERDGGDVGRARTQAEAAAMRLTLLAIRTLATDRRGDGWVRAIHDRIDAALAALDTKKDTP